MERPKHGELMLKREWDPIPWTIKDNEIKQYEIFRGHLYYRHDGSENLEDSFTFKVRDFYGKESPVQEILKSCCMFQFRR